MSSRGRGFSSRGGGSSYRGRGGGGGEWSGGSSSGNVSRGGYSSSRGGRFKYSTPSYDSRNKYASSGSERYSSRGGRGDHSNNYKRPRDSYSSRDDHRSSSESTRKRVRNDSYQGESGSSQRYSSSYGGSASSVPYDNKRSSSSAVYDDKRQSDRQSSYHRADDRHSASRGYAVPPPPRISEMAPPSQRYTSTTRGRVSHQSTNYRGRLSVRGRGTSFRSSRADILLARKRNLTTNLDYRRKLLASRSRDYIQRVRMTTAKMRRSATTRISGSKKDSGSGSTIKDKDRELAKAINAEFSDDDDEEKDAEENWDEDEKMPLVGEENEEDSKAQEKKPKDDKKKKEKPEHKNAEDNEKDDEEKEDEDETKAEGEDEEEAEGEGDENEKEEGRESDGAGNKRNGKRFIKLQCPHCSHRSTRFKEYSLHLYSGRHNNAMRRIAARHKTTLARMRVVQRQEQRKLEAKDAARGNLPSRTMFCQICKLNYRSVKALHHLSDSHRQMKRFLTPSCRVCRVQFRSPMLYETHVASLDHIKKKNSADDKVNGGNAEAEGDSSAPEEDDKEVNLDNFMTLDSVGDVDVEEGDDTIEKKKKEKPEGETTPPDVERKLKTKQMIKVGAEYIKKVEVQFCELCKIYLPRNECSERTLAMHCSTRSHLKRYVRDNDDKALRRQAERIHLQTSTTTINTSTNSTSPTEAVKTSLENSIETPAPENSTSNDVEETSEAPPVNETEPVVAAVETNAKLSQGEAEEEEEDDFRGDGGDKLWDDVDKDLGDILREAEPGKSSDDEDSRYDRFRNSDKKKQAILLSKEKKSEQPEPEETPKKLEMKIKTEKVEN